MVAYNPRWPSDESRALSPQVTMQLRETLAARWTTRDNYDSPLTEALTAAAVDARTRGLRAEELLLALKAIEEEVAEALDVVDTQNRDRFRIWLVGTCMRAFFGVERQADS